MKIGRTLAYRHYAGKEVTGRYGHMRRFPHWWRERVRVGVRSAKGGTA